MLSTSIPVKVSFIVFAPMYEKWLINAFQIATYKTFHNIFRRLMPEFFIVDLSLRKQIFRSIFS